MKKILVTGANGQLGNEMRLLAEEHRNFEYFFTDVAELDICDEQAVMEFVSAHQIDVIVNCANIRQSTRRRTTWNSATN